jgi:hypothetical protein
MPLKILISPSTVPRTLPDEVSATTLSLSAALAKRSHGEA